MRSAQSRKQTAAARGENDAAASNVDREAIRQIVREEVRSLFESLLRQESQPDVYTTRKGGAPPGWTDEGWRVVAASVPGTYRPTGADGKPGRWLVTPRAAFDAWIAGRAIATAATPRPARLPSPAANDGAAPKWHPSRTLSAVGRRLVGGRP